MQNDHKEAFSSSSMVVGYLPLQIAAIHSAWDGLHPANKVSVVSNWACVWIEQVYVRGIPSEPVGDERRWRQPSPKN